MPDYKNIAKKLKKRIDEFSMQYFQDDWEDELDAMKREANEILPSVSAD